LLGQPVEVLVPERFHQLHKKERDGYIAAPRTRSMGRGREGNLWGQRPTLRVIFMSGYTDNVIVHHGVLEEGVRFLEKPTPTSTLLKMIRVALSEQESR
jgi:CheY-like chemotaxis protein